MYSKRKGRGAAAPLRICLHISLASTCYQTVGTGWKKTSLTIFYLLSA
jgi:hypothetical protein